MPPSDDFIPHDATTNNPPADADPFMDVVREKAAALLTRQAELELKACLLPEKVESDDDLAAVNAWVLLARDLERDAEAGREEHNRPLLERQRKLSAFFKADIITPLENRRKAMTQRTTAYLQEKERLRREALRVQEEARRAEEDAARKKAQELLEAGDVKAADVALQEAATAGKVADASAKAATQAAPALARTSAGGATSTLTGKWTFRITDLKALRASLGVLGEHFTGSELEKACRNAVKAGLRDIPAGEGVPGKPAIPGVYIFLEQTARATKARGGEEG